MTYGGRRGGGGCGCFFFGLVVAALLAPAVGLLAAPLALNHKSVFPGEQWLAGLAKTRSVPDDMRGRTNPVAGDAAAAAEGRRLYSISCVACHGSNGQGNGPIGRNLFPPPASLVSDEARGLTDGETFWFIRNGISFTGMPSYGITTTTAVATYDETQIWQLVAQVRALQNAPTPAPGAAPATAPTPAASPAASPAPTGSATPTP